MYRAIKSFVGKISMNIGETKEKIEKKLADELIKAGLIEEVKSNEKPIENKEEAEEIKADEKPIEIKEEAEEVKEDKPSNTSKNKKK